jgi:hypothetical protein
MILLQLNGYMNNDELLEKINKRFDTLEQGQARTNTALEALAAGQQDIREKMATKADAQDIKNDLVKHQRRIENLEENTSTPNPHKN